ncbi:MAG: hypothetical protein K6U74_04235, partial [Firmicutes bacterium]|nr:hypothetical protein [Bacillota bacterium]
MSIERGSVFSWDEPGGYGYHVAWRGMHQQLTNCTGKFNSNIAVTLLCQKFKKPEESHVNAPFSICKVFTDKKIVEWHEMKKGVYERDGEEPGCEKSKGGHIGDIQSGFHKHERNNPGNIKPGKDMSSDFDQSSHGERLTSGEFYFRILAFLFVVTAVLLSIFAFIKELEMVSNFHELVEKTFSHPKAIFLVWVWIGILWTLFYSSFDEKNGFLFLFTVIIAFWPVIALLAINPPVLKLFLVDWTVVTLLVFVV